MNSTKCEKKFVLTKWLKDNKFDVLDVAQVFLNDDDDDEIEYDGHYKIKFKNNVYNGIVKFIGSQERCEKEFRKIGTYPLKNKVEKKSKNSENSKPSQGTNIKNQV